MALAHARVLRAVLDAVETGDGVNLDSDDVRTLVEYIASKGITPASEGMSSIEGDVLDVASGELADRVGQDVRDVIAAARPARPPVPNGNPTSAAAVEALLDEADGEAAKYKERTIQALHNHAMLEAALVMMHEHADETSAKNFIVISVGGMRTPFDRATIALHRPGTKSGEELVVERDVQIKALQADLATIDADRVAIALDQVELRERLRLAENDRDRFIAANASLAGDVAERIWRAQDNYGQVFRLAHDFLARAADVAASGDEDVFTFPDWMTVEAMSRVVCEAASSSLEEVDKESISTADAIAAVARLLWRPDPVTPL